MIPFKALAVAAIWSLRTRPAPWLAALVALWPANAYYWEFKFDLVPAALLAAGLALAWQERWTLAGIALGLGTAAKWTPALAFVALGAWLGRGALVEAAARGDRRVRRDAARGAPLRSCSGIPAASRTRTRRRATAGSPPSRSGTCCCGRSARRG